MLPAAKAGRAADLLWHDNGVVYDACGTHSGGAMRGALLTPVY